MNDVKAYEHGDVVLVKTKDPLTKKQIDDIKAMIQAEFAWADRVVVLPFGLELEFVTPPQKS